MLMPKKVKHRKQQKGRVRGVATRGYTIAFGQYGLKALETNWVTSRQIEAARRAMTRFVARGGKIWVRVFPDKAVTRKGVDIPMGKGKGSVDHYVVVAQPGRILFEMDGVTREIAKKAMQLAAYKLNVKTRFVEKNA